jgi:hypothetical protein
MVFLNVNVYRVKGKEKKTNILTIKNRKETFGSHGVFYAAG